MKKIIHLVFAFVLLHAAVGCGSSEEKGSQTAARQISGQIEAGLRVLTIDPTAQDQHFTIFRGDYVRAQLTTADTFTIKIAALNVDMRFPVVEGDRPYFKVPKVGSYRFSVGEGQGVIEAIDFTAKTYKEVNAAEGSQLIANINPVIVDVRTPGEYSEGHLADAMLIPVQEFQKRVGELAVHKTDPVFVYCRSGNRSTVAAKIMVDHGFTNVINLRSGIRGWLQAGLPVVK